MNELLALIGLTALVVIGLVLTRVVARDGLGWTAAPRSHVAELGTWADRDLRR